MISGLRPIDLAFKHNHESVIKLLLNQDIEKAFEIITEETQGNVYKSLLHEAILTKRKILGHLISCSTKETSLQGWQVELVSLFQ